MAQLDLLSTYPALASLAFHATACVVKMMVMSAWTSKHRMQRGVFANEEDAKGAGSKAKVSYNDSAVERVRRNHQNDLENIPAFIIVGIFYCLTRPSLSTAVLLFRIFTISRILHTVTYQLALPQPSRFVSFLAGYATTFYMAFQVLRAMPY